MSLGQSAYERGTQFKLIDAAVAVVTQAGNAAPAGAQELGVVANISRGQQGSTCMVQIDVAAGTVSALDVNLLGSLDGVNYYVLASFTGLTGGGIFPVAGAAQARYLSASITTRTVGSGAPEITVSIAL